jgi:hypothetical protein
MEHPSHSLDLAPNNLSFSKGRGFQDTEDRQISEDGTGSHSTTEFPKMFQTVAASLGSPGEYFESDPSQ